MVSTAGEEIGGAEVGIDDVAEDFVEHGELNDGATMGDVVGELERECLAGSSLPASALIPAS